MFNALARGLVLLSFLLAGLSSAAEGKLTVHFLDVGQGDAALIIGPTGKTVLVDGGPPSHTASFTARVAALVKGPLDLVVMSHPHLDHLGGLVEVIDRVGAKRFLDPGFDHPSKSYAELLEFLNGKADVLNPERDPDDPDSAVTIGLGEGASITVLWPRRPVEPFLSDTRSDPNSNSIVFRLQHGGVSFLFSGDAEAVTEERLLREEKIRDVTVLKVAHHGGRHSSTEDFLEVVKPKYAVISSGSDNDYGHPSREALERLTEVGAKVFRTDLQGEVIATSDGRSVTFRTSREADKSALLTGVAKGTGSRNRHESSSRKEQHPAPVDAPPSTAEVQPAAATLLSDGGTDWPAYAATLTPPPPEHGSAATSGSFVASRRSKVFHREDCRNAQRISKKNRMVFPSRAEAAKGRTPSGDCNP